MRIQETVLSVSVFATSSYEKILLSHAHKIKFPNSFDWLPWLVRRIHLVGNGVAILFS